MAIYLIRHGETDANAARIVQLPSVALSARGRDQAARLATRLARDGVGAIVSSDLARAAETAEAIARATGAPVSFDADLAERNFGDIRGTPYAAFDGDIFAPDYAPPGGETWDVFHARADRAWARVVMRAASTAGHLAVVTHGLVCHRIFAAHLDPPADRATADPPSWGNTCVTIIDGPHHRTIARLACSAHLLRTFDGAPA